MPLVQIGDPQPAIVDRQIEFDPQYGSTEVTVMEGTKETLQIWQSGFAASGVRSRLYSVPDRPVHRLEIRQIGKVFSDPDTPQDQYEFSVEFYQESVYANPKLVDLAGSDNILAGWKKRIEEAITARLTPTQFAAVSGFTGANELALFVFRLRGGQATEIERVVFRRIRYLPIKSTNAAIITAVPAVYTTNRLVALLNLPLGIAARMPLPPGPAPSGTTWGWKKRRDDSVIVPGRGQTQETKDYLFAAWSNLTHDIST